MIIFEDGSVINHCFCYMEVGKQCEREDCSGKSPYAGMSYVYQKEIKTETGDTSLSSQNEKGE